MRRWLVLAALVVTALALFPAAVFSDGVFFERDLNNLWYPRVASMVRALGEGAWPLWDPYPGFGVSAVADPSYQLFYPLTWLNAVVGPVAFFKVFVLAHVIWTSLGMRLLTRRLGLSDPAAVAAGCAWCACGPWLSLVSHYHHFAGSAWAPWVLLTFVQLVQQPTWRAAVRLGVVAAMQLLAGSADMCFFTLLLAPLVLFAAPGLGRGRVAGEGARRVWLLLGAGALACAIAAAQWLPTIDQIRGSNRAALGAQTNMYWSLHPLSLVDVVVPMAVADTPLSQSWRAAVSESREPLLHSLYLGVSSAPLVVLGFFACRRRQRWLLGGGLLWCVVAALGRNGPLYPLLLHFPLIGLFRYPAKWMVPAGILWIILLGLGLQCVAASDVQGSRRRLWLAMGVAATLCLVLLGVATQLERISPLLSEDFDSAGRGLTLTRVAGQLWIAAALAMVVGVVLAGRQRWPLRSQWWALALTLIVLVDLIWAGQGVNRLAPRELLAHRPTLLAHIHPDTASYRVFSARYTDSHPQAMLAHGPKGWSLMAASALGQIDVVRPMIYGRFRVYASFDRDPTGLLAPEVVAMAERAGQAYEAADPGALLRLLRLANVRYVVGLEDDRLSSLRRLACWDSVSARPVCVWEVSGILPRAYVVDRARLAQGSSGINVLVDSTFDAGREILVDQPSAVSGGRAGFDATARVVGRRADRVEVEARTNGDGFLVLLDGYERGWRAFVDGRAVSVLRANLLFRAASVPSGVHRVVFVYRPPAVVWGLLASGLGLLVVLVSVFWAGRGRIRRGGGL